MKPSLSGVATISKITGPNTTGSNKTIPNTIGALVRWGAKQLVSSPTAMLDARTLFLHSAQIDHAALIAQDKDPVQTKTITAFQRSLNRRAAEEPIAYIVGQQEFYGRNFAVTPDVLIPRPETEMLIEAALALLPASCQILDLGVGSGCLLGTMLAECPQAVGVGWDICEKAIAVAQKNLVAIDVAERAQVLERSFGDPTTEQFDLILSNPPYIERQADLPKSVAAFEPMTALFAGTDGLSAYRVLAGSIAQMLASHGHALLEIGTGQGRAVQELMTTAMPSRQVQVHNDLAGHQRMIVIGKQL